jgi:hypothetical protein
MRSTLVVGLYFLVVPLAVGDDKPIPQDTARMEKWSRERLEWNRRTVGGAYDKIGKKDPKWDKLARETMELAARMYSLEGDLIVTPTEIYKPSKAAIDAGCDDPFMLYLYARSSVGPNYPGDEASLSRLKAAAKALAASRYPVFRRAVSLDLAGSEALSAKVPTDAAREQAERDFDTALALLPESVATDERNSFWENIWFDTFVSIIRGYRQLGVDAVAAYERVDATLAKLPELKVLRLQLRGFFWHTYGWEARTNAFAPQVPAGGFEAFEKRLDIAQKALNEAWQLRPDDVRTADLLLDIDKAIGGGGRANMELWFDRTMKANGDQRSACFTKLDWLDPKWHGTAEEMLAFGRACRDTKNWRTGITLLVGDAHLRYSNLLAPTKRSEYLGSPEVWGDIESVYDEYLKHYPTDNEARSKYAVLAYFAGKYLESHVQFQALGDRLTTWYYFPNVPLESMKVMRNQAAQIVAGKMRPANSTTNKNDGKAKP